MTMLITDTLQSRSLRPMQDRDLIAVGRLEQEAYEFPWTVGNFRDSMLAGYDCCLMHRAATDTRTSPALLGYAVVMPGVDEAHLLNLTVAVAYQRQGHGRHLLQQLCRREQAKGAQRLLLEVRPSNLPARALYAASGFVEIGRRKHYYPAANGREDALVLALQLPVCDAAVGQAR